MLKLNAGFSRKVGEPDFGSRGACVNLELELESGLVTDPAALQARIRQLFALARQSVDAELTNTGQPQQPTNSNGTPRREGRSDARQATASQVRAIRAICDRQGIDAEQLVQQRFGATKLEALTLQEASSLIDELKAAPAGSNGGGR